MGGSVFSEHVTAVRIDRDEHDAIAAQVAEALVPLGIHARSLPPLRSKATFGDVDMVTARSHTHTNLPTDVRAAIADLDRRDAAIAAAVGADAYHRGQLGRPSLHMLLSGRHGPVQLDLMSIDDDILEFASRHMSWGDAGAMTSAVAQQMGVKMGMNGLALTIQLNATKRRLPLNLDYDQALELIGLDSTTHRAGFDTAEDIYEWLAAGRLFDRRLWSAEWMTNRRRHRALKRDSFVGLQTWLEKTQPEANYDWGERRGARIGEWTERLLETHPEARAELHRLQTASIAPTGLRAFFNGEVVRRHIDLDDDAMQHVMYALRNRIGAPRIQDLANAGDAETLDELIRCHLAELNTTA